MDEGDRGVARCLCMKDTWLVRACDLFAKMQKFIGHLQQSYSSKCHERCLSLGEEGLIKKELL